MATPVACSTISPFLRTCLRRPHRLSAAAAATAASLTRSPVTAAAASVPAALAQRRAKSDSALGDSALTAWVETPFNETANQPTTKVPDFGKYKSSRNPESNVLFQYFMAGTFGMLTAAGAKSTVQDFLVNMSASADVLAMAKVEVDLNAIPEGKNVIIKWRGKPVFIRHRTAEEIEAAQNEKWETLRDPQPDSDRVKKPEWLVMIGVCTHLGCVPIGESGDYGGWFCPCHGSHYDISGRARKGPAPLNLAIPDYDFVSDSSLVIG